MTRWTSTLVGSLALCLFSSAHGANLSEIYNAALNYDIEFRAAKADQQSQDYDVTLARSTLLPSVVASYQLKKVKDVDDTLQTWGVDASQTLFDLSKWYEYKAAKAATSVGDAQFQLAEQNLRLRAINAYFEYLRAVSSLKTARSDVAFLETIAKRTESRYNAGVASKTELLEVQAQFDLGRSNLEAQHANVDMKRNDLEQMTGLSIDAVKPLRDDLPLSTPTPNKAQAWIDLGWRDHPGIIMSQNALNASRLKRNSSRSSFAPKVDLFASYSEGDQISPINKSVRFDNSLVYGVKVSMPLLSGGGIFAKSKQSALEMVKSEVALERQRRTIAQNINTLFLTLKTDILAAKAKKRALVSARKALDAVRSSYNAGTRSAVDVLDAQKDVTRTLADVNKAQFDYVEHWAALRFYAGQLSVHDIEVINQWLDV